MLDGVTILDPASTVIDRQVTVGQDTIIAAQTHLLGASVVGQDCRIGPHVVIEDSRLGDGVCVEPFSVVRRQTIPAGTTLPSFSHRTSA
jgi:bifunctional UDP-N-acetylglucosamine pyrophosphorylase/glucosamine-1-phosphate N-acetyltransferase